MTEDRTEDRNDERRIRYEETAWGKDEYGQWNEIGGWHWTCFLPRTNGLGHTVACSQHSATRSAGHHNTYVDQPYKTRKTAERGWLLHARNRHPEHKYRLT